MGLISFLIIKLVYIHTRMYTNVRVPKRTNIQID